MASQRRFAELYLNKPQDLWNNVLWTDKTKGESGVFFCEVRQLKLGPQQIFSKMGGKEKNQDACKGPAIVQTAIWLKYCTRTCKRAVIKHTHHNEVMQRSKEEWAGGSALAQWVNRRPHPTRLECSGLCLSLICSTLLFHLSKLSLIHHPINANIKPGLKSKTVGQNFSTTMEDTNKVMHMLISTKSVSIGWWCVLNLSHTAFDFWP